MAGPFPPRPSVEHLVTVFRRIDARNILIPAFQRTFVWRESQVLALLESVYSGFPIGSILLWHVERPILKVSQSPDVPFPKGSEKYPADFVLDGLQRLSTLYGVFHFGSATNNEMFNVVFNLKDKKFYHADESDDSDGPSIPLNALFNPRSLLDVQQQLLKRASGDKLIDTVLTLQSRFQEYMVPIVTLAEREPNEVVAIFERVNSTGTRLSRVDFMRAITWSSQFDLNDALDAIGSELRDDDFDFSDDTLVKALGLAFKLDPLPDIMLRLREKSSTELADAVNRTKETFLRLIEFFKSDMHIFGSDFVPYEGQILALFSVFLNRPKIDSSTRDDLKKWFFRVSFSEGLQGKPDHYVARLIKRIATRLASELSTPARTDFFSLASKRMIKGKALSTAFVSLFGELGARSLVDGRPIPHEEYLRSFDPSNFVPIFDRDQLPASYGGEGNSAKVFANLVLVPPSDAPMLKRSSAIELLRSMYSTTDPIAQSTARSQMLPIVVPDTLQSDPYEFLFLRSELFDTEMTKLIE